MARRESGPVAHRAQEPCIRRVQGRGKNDSKRPWRGPKRASTNHGQCKQKRRDSLSSMATGRRGQPNSIEGDRAANPPHRLPPQSWRTAAQSTPRPQLLGIVAAVPPRAPPAMSPCLAHALQHAQPCPSATAVLAPPRGRTRTDEQQVLTRPSVCVCSAAGGRSLAPARPAPPRCGSRSMDLMG